MISYVEAIQKIRVSSASRRELFIVDHETLSVEANEASELLGRHLAEHIYVQEAVPPFDNSAMDGFALRAEWTREASSQTPVVFQNKGTVFAGGNSSLELSLNSPDCIEIMTGAPLPKGADSVVKIEDVEFDGASSIRVLRRVTSGENVRKRGSDFQQGEKLLEKNLEISAEHILGFATVGISQVKVLRKPVVAVLSTGQELTETLSENLKPGMIRNSTAPYLMSALSALGVNAKYYGVVRDDVDAFKKIMQFILSEKTDIIITTGAVSKGKLDFIPDSLRDLGAKVVFHGVSIRPGKPILFGEFDQGPVIFSLPGNPISTAVALRFFICPYLDNLKGLEAEVPTQASLKKSLEKPIGLKFFSKAYVENTSHGLVVTQLNGQESYKVSTMLPANAWILHDEEGETALEGSSVETVPLYPTPQKKLGAGGTFGIEKGSCC